MGIKKNKNWVVVAAEKFSGGSTCQITKPKIRAKKSGGKNFFAWFIAVRFTIAVVGKSVHNMGIFKI